MHTLCFNQCAVKWFFFCHYSNYSFFCLQWLAPFDDVGHIKLLISLWFVPIWFRKCIGLKMFPWRPEGFNSPRQILTLLNKVPGYWLQGETDFANKPRMLQIFPHSKFGINRTAGLKVMAKKFKFWPRNFLAITFKPAVRLISNFECGKICKILGLFAKSVSPWSQ